MARRGVRGTWSSVTARDQDGGARGDSHRKQQHDERDASTAR
jgi:hypothetical protein